MAMGRSRRDSSPSVVRSSTSHTVMTGASTVATPIPSRQAEVAIAARHLANMDLFSKSDPFVAMYQAPPAQSSGLAEPPPVWELIGTTETIDNDLNPDFVTRFVFPLVTADDEAVRLKADVYDRDNDKDFSRQDFIGSAECTLRELLTAAVLTLNLSLRSGRESRRRGSIIFFGEVQAPLLRNPRNPAMGVVPTREVSFYFGVQRSANLDDRDSFFFAVSKQAVRGRQLFSRLYRSSSQMGAQITDGLFPGVVMTGMELCGEDTSRRFRIELYKNGRRGAYALLGCLETCIEDLRHAERAGAVMKLMIGPTSGLTFGEVELDSVKWRSPGNPSIICVKAANFIFDR